MMSIVRKISYHPWIVAVVRFLHLEKWLKRIYFYWARPTDGFFFLKLGGIEASLYINKPEELRFLESLAKPEGEKAILEDLMGALKAGDHVFDVGAHLGLYTVFLAKKVGPMGKVFAFEPDQIVLGNLKKSLAQNNLSNVVLFSKALGNFNGTSQLYRGETIGNASLVKTYKKVVGQEQIEIVLGDDLNVSIPKAVKIDVEGFEYEVLLGLSETLKNPQCQILCCEIHPGILPDGIDEQKIISFIQSLGFSKITPRQRQLNSYHLLCEKF